MKKVLSGPKNKRNYIGYLDETGLLTNSDRYFGLGLLTCLDINELHRRLIVFRNKSNYHKEFKFTHIGTHNILYYKDLLKEFFTIPNCSFVAAVYDKSNIKIKDSDKAYNSYCGQIISDHIKMLETDKTSDYFTLLADDISTPKHNRFEKEIRNKVKAKLRRNAINNIVRLESHAVTEIQLTDVLIGTVVYSYKVQMGLVKKPQNAKIQLVKHLQKLLHINKLSSPMETKVKNGIRFAIKEFN